MRKVLFFLFMILSFKAYSNEITFEEMSSLVKEIIKEKFIDQLKNDIIKPDGSQNSVDSSYKIKLQVLNDINNGCRVAIIPICNNDIEDICKIIENKKMSVYNLIGYYVYIWNEKTYQITVLEFDSQALKVISRTSYVGKMNEGVVHLSLISSAYNYLVISFKNINGYYLYYRHPKIEFIRPEILNGSRYVDYEMFMNEFCE